METDLQRFHRWFEEVWNQRKEATIEELLSPDGVGHGFGAEPLKGPEGFRQVWQTFLTAIPDLHVTMDHAIESDGYTAGHITCTGHHGGDGLGVPATGRPIAFKAHIYSRWKDGQIAEAWNLVDMASIQAQIASI